MCRRQGFMTAVKQTYSRDYKIAIDTLVVGCEMMSFDLQGIKSLPKDGTHTRMTSHISQGYPINTMQCLTPHASYCAPCNDWT